MKFDKNSFFRNLACPSCFTKLKVNNLKLFCLDCKQKYNIRYGIPILTENESFWDDKLKMSKREYEKLFRHKWMRVSDGSYECLAAIARGNKTLDVACGEGWIEKLSPETVGVDISINALRRAKKNGAKYLVCASAEKLPFPDNSFDLCICAGSLEHFVDPRKAVKEISRVSEIQVLTVHRQLPIPFARQLRNIAVKVKGIEQQPIEDPLTWKEVKGIYKAAGLKIIFNGFWTYPMDLGLLVPKSPIKLAPASSFFIMSRKSDM